MLCEKLGRVAESEGSWRHSCKFMMMMMAIACWFIAVNIGLYNTMVLALHGRLGALADVLSPGRLP